MRGLLIVSCVVLGLGIASGARATGHCPADLTGNNNVGVPDLLELLGNWGPCPAPCPADLTGNSSVGVPDLLDLLSNWGDCPEPPSPCDDPAAGDCFVANGTAGCDDPDCCTSVCDVDPFCCDVEWDSHCANTATNLCGTLACGEPVAGPCCSPNGTPYCNDAACCNLICFQDPFCCEVEWDGLCAGAASVQCEGCCTWPDPTSPACVTFDP